MEVVDRTGSKGWGGGGGKLWSFVELTDISGVCVPDFRF